MNALFSFLIFVPLVAGMVGVFMLLMHMVAKEENEITEAMSSEPEKKI